MWRKLKLEVKAIIKENIENIEIDMTLYKFKVHHNKTGGIKHKYG